MFPSLGAVLCLLSCRSKKVRPPAGTTDILENVTTYGYHADTNVLEWVKYPEDTDATKTSYTYDDMYRLATAAATTDTELAMSARYTYNDKDHLASITTPTTTYNFTYGNFGLRTSVSVGTQPLATYEYTNDENNYLEVLAYGNGDSVLYNYDDLGRLTTQTYQDDSDKVTYAYDNNGDLAQVYDSGSGITTKYYYDLIGRAMKYTETKSGYSHSVEYAYDTQNNLSSQTEIINGTEHNTTYTYDKDNRVTSKVTDNIGVYYTYDSFGRLTQQVTKNNGTVVLTETYTYKAGSAQIASHSTVGTNYSVTYSYTYDANGNILTVSDGTNTTSYVYDSANQVVRENNQAGNYTYTWTYDNAGNIQSKKVYDYTTGNLPETPTDTVAYGYNDEQWGDLLTSYDGSNITYDTIGNPDGYGNKSFTWEHGRELATLTQGANTWTYTYDANGMRTGRVCSNTYYYEYIYDGSQLIQMNSSSGTLYFTYDASGKPLTLTQGTTTYTYVTNLQGDVIGILNSNGKQVVTYTYDAWGNCTSSASDPIIMYNPLLYRGYVYDKETGLYYLQSRYYDPEIGRFINADGLVATGQGVTGNNLFAYCGNNPICFVDLNGMWRQVVGGWQAEIGDTLWGLAVQLYGNGSKWTTFGFGRDPKTLIVGEIIHTSNSINTTGSHGGKISLGIRDVTHEVNNALKGYISVAEDFAQLANAIPLYEIYRYGVFAGLVNHGATWDIKRKGPWESTIGTPFPGVGTPILYCGIKMTPENLGNLTYGLLGAAFGIPCQTLIDGSVFAAISSGAFRNMKGINNEFDDWLFIQLGYLSYRP